MSQFSVLVVHDHLEPDSLFHQNVLYDLVFEKTVLKIK